MCCTVAIVRIDPEGTRRKVRIQAVAGIVVGRGSQLVHGNSRR